jgi:flagellar basal body-associated protein FliL
MSKSISPATAIVIILIVVVIVAAVGYFGFMKKGKKAGAGSTDPGADQKQAIKEQMQKQAQSGKTGGSPAPPGAAPPQ